MRPAQARYGILLICCGLSLVVQGAVPPSDVQRVAVTTLAAACLVLALRAAHPPEVVLQAAVFAATLAILASLGAIAGIDMGDGAVRAMNAALLLVGPPAVAVGVVHDLRATGGVRIQAVLGVVALYLLIGMLFGFVYGALDHFGSEPVFENGVSATVAHCVYFSFTTLTTVGFGDIVTRTNVGHTLAISEALIGQIYLVTVVSVLVSNLGRRPRDAGR
jgi:hypothetical protein